MKKMRKLLGLLALAVVVLPLARPAAASSSASTDTDTNNHHVIAMLHPVAGSHVFGFVGLTQLHDGGTRIHVLAFGLTPGDEYVSLYYDNNTCTLPGDELSDPYTANAHGIGTTH